jgi:hypothetical protein
MTDGIEELLEDLRVRLAHREGELQATRAQLAAQEATEAQLRLEIETARVEAATAQDSLSHLQRQGEEQQRVLRSRMGELEEQRDQAVQARRQAEQERAAVIAALGRRARRLVEADSGG